MSYDEGNLIDIIYRPALSRAWTERPPRWTGDWHGAPRALLNANAAEAGGRLVLRAASGRRRATTGPKGQPVIDDEARLARAKPWWSQVKLLFGTNRGG